MLNAANRMEQALSLLRGQRGEVTASIESLARSFTGNSANEFKGAFTQWYGNVEVIERALQELLNTMREGGQHVGQSDTDTTNTAQEGSRSMNSNYGLNGL